MNAIRRRLSQLEARLPSAGEPAYNEWAAAELLRRLDAIHSRPEDLLSETGPEVDEANEQIQAWFDDWRRRRSTLGDY